MWNSGTSNVKQRGARGHSAARPIAVLDIAEPLPISRNHRK